MADWQQPNNLKVIIRILSCNGEHRNETDGFMHNDRSIIFPIHQAVIRFVMSVFLRVIWQFVTVTAS